MNTIKRFGSSNFIFLYMILTFVVFLGTSRSSAALIPQGQRLMNNILVPLNANNIDSTSIANLPNKSVLLDTPTSTINVSYTNFPVTAEASFDYAVSIWETLIDTPVPIEITAEWTQLSEDALGQSGPFDFWRDFEGSLVANTWYAYPLANRIAGFDLDPYNPDIIVQINSDIDWYFGTDGNVPSSQYDLTTVGLQMVGLGLGFISSTNVNLLGLGLGSWGGFTGFPTIYDRFLANGFNENLTSTFPNFSSQLAGQLTSNSIFFGSPNATISNDGTAPKLYAPTEWESGFSISHLDEDTFPSGNVNSLMTPFLNSMEANHNPGPVALNMLKDMGWETFEIVTECSNANKSLQPILMVTGWGGSVGSTSIVDDDQLKYFVDYKDGYVGHLTPLGYVEGCNLFYAVGTSPQMFLRINAITIYANLCLAYDQVKAFNPDWNGHFDIIAHSYGGLRSREYLENNTLYGRPCENNQQIVEVDNLFTMGTPHGGEPYPDGDFGNMLPFASVIGFCARFPAFCGNRDDNEPQWPALAEMWPEDRSDHNESHHQPDGVCYYLLTGDARIQSPIFPYPLNAFYDLWPASTVRENPNDLAVHFDSSVVLVSDFKENYPRTEILFSNSLHGHIPENVIGDHSLKSFVYPSNIFDDQIAPRLGGQDCISNTLLESEVNDKYHSIEETIEGEGVSPSKTPVQDIATGILLGSDAVSGQLEITSSGDSQITLYWMSGDIDFSLTDPSDNVINANNIDSYPNIDYLSFDTDFGFMGTYIFSSIEVGTWEYNITSNIDNDTTGYHLLYVPSEPISVSISAPQWVPNSSAVDIIATVSHDNSTLLPGGSVSAQINHPDGSSNTINLLDDGDNNDGQENDGIFGATYIQTQDGGIYGIVITATGLYSGTNYIRTASALVTVAPDNSSFTGNFSDSRVDDNGDGLYEWLEIQTEVNVTTCGYYAISADLYADTTYISRSRTEKSLCSGTHNVSLLFLGQDIKTHQIDGPYTIQNLMIFDETAISLLISSADDVYITPPYNFNEFGFLSKLYLPTILK